MNKISRRSFFQKLIVFLLVPLMVIILPSSSAYSDSFIPEKNQELISYGYSAGSTVVVSNPYPYKSEPFSVYLFDNYGIIHQYDFILTYNLSFDTEDELKNTMRDLNVVFKNIFEEYSYEDFLYNRAIVDIHERFRNYLDTNNFKRNQDEKGNQNLRAKFAIGSIAIYDEDRTAFKACGSYGDNELLILLNSIGCPDN